MKGNISDIIFIYVDWNGLPTLELSAIALGLSPTPPKYLKFYDPKY